MRVVVVKDEKDFAELRKRVLRPGLSGARRLAVEETIRAANPHLDLDRLPPGAVVVVPDHPDVAPDAGDPGRPGPDLGRLHTALPKVGEAARRGAEAAAARNGELRKALRTREVRAAAEADEKLAAEMARLSEAIAAEQRRAEEWALAVAAHTDQWQAALDRLRGLS